MNLVKFPDMYTCAVRNFYYKLMNNLLPIYFENCKPTLPRIDQLYNVRKPVFHLPKIKHKFAEQLPDYQLVKLLNKNGSFRISSKVFTHSKKGFSSYVKNIIIETYILDILDLPVLLSHCVAFMTDLNVGQIISNTNSLVLIQF